MYLRMAALDGSGKNVDEGGGATKDPPLQTKGGAPNAM